MGEEICIRFFFFQGESGIRSAQGVRGLGNLYKRTPPRWLAGLVGGELGSLGPPPRAERIRSEGEK